MNLVQKIFKKKERRQPFGGIDTYNTEPTLIKEYKNIDSKLLKKYGNSQSFNKNIKLLIFADTHGHISIDPDYNFKIIPNDIDACILLGDISKNDIEVILRHIEKDKIFGILGNHDYDTNLSDFNIPNINGTIKEINGIKFAGFEGCIKYKEIQPGYSLEDGFKMAKELEATDICITHAPPFGSAGMNHNSIHIGVPYVNEYIYKNHCPIVICGHNHVDYIHELSNGTKVIGTYKQRIIEINNMNITSIY